MSRAATPASRFPHKTRGAAEMPPSGAKQEHAVPDKNPTSTAGAFAPLRQPVFAVLWAATVLGNVGSFMRDVASSWLVTDLSASPDGRWR